MNYREQGAKQTRLKSSGGRKAVFSECGPWTNGASNSVINADSQADHIDSEAPGAEGHPAWFR